MVTVTTLFRRSKTILQNIDLYFPVSDRTLDRGCRTAGAFPIPEQRPPSLSIKLRFKLQRRLLNMDKEL